MLFLFRASHSVGLWQELAWNVNFINPVNQHIVSETGVVFKPEKLEKGRRNKDSRIFVRKAKTVDDFSAVNYLDNQNVSIS